MIEELNRSFRDGHPTNALHRAGVLIHVFEGLCREGRAPDRSCGVTPWRDVCEPNGESVRRKFFPSSVVNHADFREVAFSGGTGGVIWNGLVVKMNCAYAGDGCSWGKRPNGCMCGRDGWTCKVQCPAPSLEAALSHGPDPKSHAQHNEVIIDEASVKAELPRSILAFWYDARPSGRTRGVFCKPPGQERWSAVKIIEQYHRRFLREHALQPDDVPLVAIDWKSGLPYART